MNSMAVSRSKTFGATFYSLRGYTILRLITNDHARGKLYLHEWLSKASFVMSRIWASNLDLDPTKRPF